MRALGLPALAKGLGCLARLKVSAGAPVPVALKTILGAEGAHIFGALLLTFLLDKHSGQGL